MPFLQYHHFQPIMYHKTVVVISQKYCSWGICPRRVRKNFPHCFHDFINFPSLALTPAFRDPETICKLQLPISTSFGSSLSSIASSTAQFVLEPSNEVGSYLFLKGLQCFLLLTDTSYLCLHDPWTGIKIHCFN